MCGAVANVCFGPKADIGPDLLDHLVGASDKAWRYGETNRFSCASIDHHLIFGCLLHGEFVWLGALQDFVDVGGGASVQISEVGRVTYQTTRLHILLGTEHCRQPMFASEISEPFSMSNIQR